MSRFKEALKHSLFYTLLVGLLFVFFTCLTSCVTSQKQAQRKINRLVAKFPGVVLADTVTKITEKVEVDTVFKPGRDTVIIKEGKLTIKHFYNKEVDTIFLQGTCEADTIKLPGKIIKTKQTTAEKLKDLWWVWLIGAATFTAILLFKK